MSEWIFTFGTNHVHPVTGESLGRRFVAIKAADAATARVEMFAAFGPKWAMEYASRENAGVERFGLVELDLEEVRSATKGVAAATPDLAEDERDDEVTR